MSLKAFHLVFVSASTLMALGVGGWGLWRYFSPGGALWQLLLAIASLVLAAGMVWYGKYFLKKLKEISYL